ncbi:MAG: ion transporter [Gemmatimonadaceae bacterium]
MKQTTPPSLTRERVKLLNQIEDWLETPMLVLGFVWLGLLVLEFTRGLNASLTLLATVIWVVFIADFILRLVIAPRKTRYLKRNWLTALSLLVPALRAFRVVRVLRFLRFARAARGATMVRVIASINRSMRALGRTLGRRGSGYIAGLTAVVLFAGAAGMLAFERDVSDPAGIHDFGTALWWTAMVLTTMGSTYFPKTVEGRALCILLALYAFTVFGYVTATLATFFLSRDAEEEEGEIAGSKDLADLRAEISALRGEIGALSFAARGARAGE